MNLKIYIEELKRRNVIKAGIAYLVVAWLILQLASIVLPTFNAPVYFIKTLMFILIIGFPINLIFAWVYELTAEGIKKTKSIDLNTSMAAQTNNRLNKVIIVAFTLIIVLLVVNEFMGNSDNVGDKDDVITSLDPKDKSIAVLAFADMSQEKNQEYFSDGISAEIISLLGKIHELTVIDRRSSFSFKGKNATTKQIGKELNVSHILDGSIRKYDDKVRIDVQLIDASDGSQLWLETYDRKMDDIFKIQEDIAESVMSHLKIVLGTNKGIRIEQRPTTNIEAYRLYLQGLYYINLSGFSNINNAISLLEKAIELDPNFALAYAVLAKTYILNEIDLDPTIKWGKKAFVTLQKSLSLDPNLAENYVARGMWYWTPSNNFEHEKAIQDFEKAIELKPGLSSAYEGLMLVQLHLGLLDKALETGKKGIEIEPTSMWMRHFLGQVYYFQGNYSEALKMYESVSEKFIPFFRIALTAQTLNYQGKIKEATQMIEQGLLKYPTEPQLNSTYAIILASAGRNDEARQRMDIAIENQKALRHVHHLYHNLASASALMGHNEEAMKWLIKAAENGLPCYPLFHQDPNLARLKGYPDFEVFMLEMKNNLVYYKSL